MKKILILMAFIISVVANAFAYGSAEIKKVWLEHDVTFNSEKGIMIHIEFSVHGVKGNDVSPCVYFYNESKNALKGGISGYKTTSGVVSISNTSKATYDDSYWKDFKLFMPLRAIPMTSGKHTYYVKVDIYDDNQGHFLTNSNDYISFIGTGSGNNSNRNYQAQYHQNSNNNSVRTWREDLDYGGFVIVTQYPDGGRQRVRYRTCPNCWGRQICQMCYGTGLCGLCNGAGGIVSAGYGNYIPCALCNYTGFCSACKGTGKCMCNDYGYPGYVIGSTTMLAPDGTILSSDKSDYGSGSSRSSSRSSGSSRGGVCSKCGGRQYDSTPHSYAAASTHGWLQPYHHRGGSGCPYCTSGTDHYHYPCTSCRGYGHQ